MQSYRLLLDTNVLLDYCDGSRPRCHEAVCLISTAVKYGHELLVSPTSLKDVFFILERTLKQRARGADPSRVLTEQTSNAINQVVWSYLESVCEWVTPVGIDMGDIWMARKHKAVHRDFEDNLVVAAALRAGADFLVTNDARLMLESQANAVTPATAIAIIESRDSL